MSFLLSDLLFELCELGYSHGILCVPATISTLIMAKRSKAGVKLVYLLAKCHVHRLIEPSLPYEADSSQKIELIGG